MPLRLLTNHIALSVYMARNTTLQICQFGFVRKMHMNYIMLKDICAINMGQSPDSNSYNDEGYGLPFFQGNADFGERYPIAKKWCSAPQKIAKPEDILISVRAPIGAVNYAKEKCCIGRGLAAITLDKSKVSKEFIFWLLKSKNQELNNKGVGSTFKSIGRKVLEETLVPDLTKEKQMRYSEILEKLYFIIQSRMLQQKELDELVKARFVEMFGDPVINSKNLATKELKNVMALKAGDFTVASDILDEPSESNPYPCYGGNGVRGYVAEYNQEGEYSLIGRQGALSGNVQYVNGKFKNTEHALLVTPLVEINSIWLNQLLLNLDLKRYQTGAAQPGISVKNLQEIPIVCVSIDEQNQFADFVRQIAKSKSVIEKSLKELETLQASLMQKYFS